MSKIPIKRLLLIRRYLDLIKDLLLCFNALPSFQFIFFESAFSPISCPVGFPHPTGLGEKNPRFVSIKVFLQRPGNVEKKLNVIYCFPDARSLGPNSHSRLSSGAA